MEIKAREVVFWKFLEASDHKGFGWPRDNWCHSWKMRTSFTKKYHKHSLPIFSQKKSGGKECFGIKIVYYPIWPSNIARLANSDIDES